MESLNEDWKEFCAKYRLEHNPLKHINKTKSIVDWKDLYRIYPEASQLVYDLYNYIGSYNFMSLNEI